MSAKLYAFYVRRDLTSSWFKVLTKKLMEAFVTVAFAPF